MTMWDALRKMANGLASGQRQEIGTQAGFSILKEKLAGLSEQVKGKALYQFARILDIEAAGSDYDSDKKEYKKVFIRFQVVLVNFIGPDRVIDESHPAIVWEAKQKNGHIVVIPLTSKKDKEFSFYKLRRKTPFFKYGDVSRHH
jgi:hypothetical protein